MKQEEGALVSLTMLAGRCWGFILKVKGKQICIRYLWLKVWRFQVLNREARLGEGELIRAERVAASLTRTLLIHFRACNGNILTVHWAVTK